MTRQSLTPRERKAMEAAQNGVCAKCGGCGPFEADHSTPVAWKSGKPDWLLCIPCHRRKTHGTKATTAGSDIHRIAKCKRLRGETKGRPKRNWPSGQIPSRPFNRERRT